MNNDYTEHSPFASVHENGEDYLLTALKIQQYQELYKSRDEDMQSPYFAPLLAEDLSGQPRTLIITAEYDPLRDEGEEYGRRLKEAEMMWRSTGSEMRCTAISRWELNIIVLKKALS